MATIAESQLGQLRNASGGTAESLYSPGASTTGILKSITVCNQSGATDTYRIFLDDDGTTYDATTALFYDVSIDAGESHILNVYWPMNDATGNCAVSCATTAACTFTAFGLEIT
jgi:hypothetical protein